jgi:hypothetical protein
MDPKNGLGRRTWKPRLKNSEFGLQASDMASSNTSASLDTNFADPPGTIPNTSSLEASPSSYVHQYPRSLPRILELYRRPFDLNCPRTGDENIHQSPGALLPVRAARHVGHPDQGAK